jgi:hypothetical protein
MPSTPAIWIFRHDMRVAQALIEEIAAGKIR